MAPVEIAPYISYGFGSLTSVRDPLFHLTDSEILFAIGRHLVVQNVFTHNFRQLPYSQSLEQVSTQFSSLGKITAVEICNRRKYVAVCRDNTLNYGSGHSKICIYNVYVEKAKNNESDIAKEIRVLPIEGASVYAIAFSSDAKFLICQLDSPPYNVIVWDWVRSLRIASMEFKVKLSRIRFHPLDNAQISTSSNNHMRLWKIADRILKPYPLISGLHHSTNFIDHIWVQNERLVTITEQGHLYVIKDCEVLQFFQSLQGGAPLKSIASCKNGFVVGGHKGVLTWFTLSDEFPHVDFQVSLTIRIKKREDVLAISFEPSEASFICTMKTGYGIFKLSECFLEGDVKEEIELSFHSPETHGGSISSLSSCVRKPVVVSCCSEIPSISVWNYKLCNIMITEKFPDLYPLSVSIHPSGYQLLIAFSTRIQLHHILMDKLKLAMEINVKGANMILFSPGGSFFAIVCGKVIHVYSMFGATMSGIPISLGVIRVHVHAITDICWSFDDTSLFSCDHEGHVYEWFMKGISEGGVNHRAHYFPGACCISLCTDSQGNLLVSHSKIDEATKTSLLHMPITPGIWLKDISGPSTLSVIWGTTTGTKTAPNNVTTTTATATATAANTTNNVTTFNHSTKRKEEESNYFTIGGNGNGNGGGKEGGSNLHDNKRDLSTNELLLPLVPATTTTDQEGILLNCNTSFGLITRMLISQDRLYVATSHGDLFVYPWWDVGLSSWNCGNQFYLPLHANGITGMSIGLSEGKLITSGKDGVLFISTIEKGGGSMCSPTLSLSEESIFQMDRKDYERNESTTLHLQAQVVQFQEEKEIHLKSLETEQMQMQNKMETEMKKLQFCKEKEMENFTETTKQMEKKFQLENEKKQKEYMQSVRELDQLHQKKMDIQMQKYQQLVTTHQEFQLAYQDEKYQLEEMYFSQSKKNQKEYQHLNVTIQSQVATLQQELENQQKKYEILLEQEEKDHQLEILQIKAKLQQTQESIILEKSEGKGKITVLEKNIRVLNQSVKNKDTTIANLIVEREQMESSLKDSFLVHQELQKKIDLHDQVIEDYERKLKLEIHKINELTNQHQATQHKLKLMDKDSKEISYQEMEEQSRELGYENERKTKIIDDLETELQEQQKKNQSLTVQMQKQHQEKQFLHSQYEKLAQHLDLLVTNPDQTSWRSQLLQIHQEYVVQQPHLHQDIQYKQIQESKIIEDLVLQKKMMQKDISSLRKKYTMIKDEKDLMKQKLLKDNSLLLDEINQLRKNHYYSKIHHHQQQQHYHQNNNHIGNNNNNNHRISNHIAPNDNPPPISFPSPTSLVDDFPFFTCNDNSQNLLLVNDPSTDSRLVSTNSTQLKQLPISFKGGHSSTSSSTSTSTSSSSSSLEKHPNVARLFRGRPLSAGIASYERLSNNKINKKAIHDSNSTHDSNLTRRTKPPRNDLFSNNTNNNTQRNELKDPKIAQTSSIDRMRRTKSASMTSLH